MSESYRLKEMKSDLPGVVYAIYLLETNISKKDIFSIQHKLKKCIEKYTYVSYLLVSSNTDSKYCVRRKIKLKKGRGRYKTIVIGKKIDMHIHLAVMGDEEKSAYKCVEEIKEAINNRIKGKKCTSVPKGKEVHAKNFINYCLKQANHINKSGRFNDLLEKEEVIKIDYL